MSPARRKPNQARKKSSPPTGPPDLWRAVPELEQPEAIVPASDASAMLRSLGTPPLPGQEAVADHYLSAVVERAAGLATALAAAAGILAEAEQD